VRIEGKDFCAGAILEDLGGIRRVTRAMPILRRRLMGLDLLQVAMLCEDRGWKFSVCGRPTSSPTASGS